MTEAGNILLVATGSPIPSGAQRVLGELRPLKELPPERSPGAEDLEDTDLVVLTEETARENPSLAPWLRGLSMAPLLLLRETEEKIPRSLGDFDDAALVDDDQDIGRRASLLLSFGEVWTRALELGLTCEDLEVELARYGLDRRFVGPRGLSPPGRITLATVVDVEMVTRQQMAICRLMGTAHGTFRHAAEPRGLAGEGGEEARTAALSPFCAYLSAQGRRCMDSEFDAAREALITQAPVERVCKGGIPLYSVPVCLTFKGLTYPLYAATVAVGGVPGDERTARVASEYAVSPEILGQMAIESRFWVLNQDKAEEIKRTIANLAESTSRETSHKYATAYQLFLGLLKEREVRRSERLLAESHEELFETNRRLKLKNEEIYDLTQAITHDLKKPLSSMKASLGLLRGGRLGDLGEQQMLAVETGYEASGYMQSLVEDLLESARLDTGRKLLELQENPLLPLLEKIRRRLQYQLQEKEVALDFRDLPESVYADESSLEKVFMNLIGNAVNYIGEGKKEITVRAELLEDHVRLTVEDTGLGIPESSLPCVFEKFRRGENVAGIQGTGLGLAIVDGIVRAHGGAVTIESEVGVGTTVSFTFPFAQEGESSQEEQLAGFAETEQGR